MPPGPEPETPPLPAPDSPAPEEAASVGPPPPAAPGGLAGWQMALLIALLLLYTIAASLRPMAPLRRAVLDRSAKMQTALRMTKLAYAERQEALRSAVSSVESRPLQKQADAVLKEWRELADSARGGGPDAARVFRRQGIVSFALGGRDGLAAFRQIAKLPPWKPPPDSETVRALQPEPAPLPPAEEVRMWEALYGPGRLDRSRVPAVRETLQKLNLNWYENLAVAALYERAGMPAEAELSRQRALASTRSLSRLIQIQGLFILLGFFGCALLAHRWKRLREKRRGATLATEFLTGSEPKTSAFPAQTLLMAFIVYLGATELLGLLALPLRGTLQQLPEAALGRIAVGLNLAIQGLIVLLVFWMLRRAGTRLEGRPPSLRRILAQLGFHARNLPAEIFAGVIGFALSRPLMIAAALLSDALFRNIPTPPHPVNSWLSTMQSPLAMAIMLAQTALLAPMVEEGLFRGALFPALKPRWGLWGAVALSSAIFALVHPTLPGGFLPLATLGATFALAAQWRGGSLVAPIVMHGMHNGFILLTQYATLAR